MTTLELGIFAIVAYAIGFMTQLAAPKAEKKAWQLILLIINVAAISFHGLQLHWLIDLPQGQNLGWTNLLSLLCWLSVLIIFFTGIVLPVRSLNIIMFPAAIIAIGISVLHPTSLMMATAYHPKELWHILLSTLVVAMLVISGVQAFLVLIQQFCLARKKMLSVLELLPALQMMQRLLFWEISLCFIGLTLLLVTSFVTFGDITALQFWFKSVLALILWIVFLGLIVGRWLFNWRTQTAAIWTTAGVGLSILLYLPSHMAVH